MAIELLPYNPKVQTLRATTRPQDLVDLACGTTQKGVQACVENVVSDYDKALSKNCFLLKAGHTSVFEHASITFLLTSISRGVADQLRTHRISSTTMSSTHYSDVSGYRHFVDNQRVDSKEVRAAIEHTMEVYASLDGPERRQVLPMSTEVQVLWTINARSLVNFLTERLCYRNMDEMVLLAERIQESCLAWWPEYFSLFGRECEGLNAKCSQGKMACKRRDRIKQIGAY